MQNVWRNGTFKIICAKTLMFFAKFIFIKKLRYKCKSIISEKFLLPSSKELLLWNGIMSNQDTLKYIIENKCSVARYGDGEFGYMLFKNFKHFFQPYNKKLQEKLKNIILNPIDNCLVALPLWIKILPENESQKAFQSRYWYHLRKYGHQNTAYGSSNCFSSGDYISENLELIKKIWDKKDIVVVTGKNSTFVWIDELFGNSNSHKFVYTKPVDAFSEYDKIIEEVSKQPKDSLILISLGITATVLAYDLTKLGYQAIDIGHISNYFLTKIKGMEDINCLRKEGKYKDGITDIHTLIKEAGYEEKI